VGVRVLGALIFVPQGSYKPPALALNLTHKKKSDIMKE
jgi:hypothetical protein